MISTKHLLRSIILSTLVLAGCATVPEDPYARVHANKPSSILIPPVVNNSVDVMAGTSVLSTLPKGLGEKGFYVFPVNTVKSLLEFEGFGDAAEIHNLPPSNLANLFDADSILYVTINSWTSKYLVLVTETEVDISYKIVSSEGEELWQDRERLTYTPRNNSTGNPFSDLLAQAISSAIERAAPNYLPLTRQANANVFYNPSYPFPLGPYHPYYLDYYDEL
ncbi:DUF799 domain-containing protein [Salinibius halmophilus]|uniref:DUF799 domain-containing protein n=1 Tax=Salinibius halmophilus TaxID=1853216 RepID=UPI000E66C98D|nr:GNA1162 family protein [Salinibius halmophilus]